MVFFLISFFYNFFLLWEWVCYFFFFLILNSNYNSNYNSNHNIIHYYINHNNYATNYLDCNQHCNYFDFNANHYLNFRFQILDLDCSFYYFPGTDNLSCSPASSDLNFNSSYISLFLPLFQIQSSHFISFKLLHLWVTKLFPISY